MMISREGTSRIRQVVKDLKSSSLDHDVDTLKNVYQYPRIFKQF